MKEIISQMLNTSTLTLTLLPILVWKSLISILALVRKSLTPWKSHQDQNVEPS